MGAPPSFGCTAVPTSSISAAAVLGLTVGNFSCITSAASSGWAMAYVMPLNGAVVKRSTSSGSSFAISVVVVMAAP